MVRAETSIPKLTVAGTFEEVGRATGERFAERLRHASGDTLESLSLSAPAMSERLQPVRTIVRAHFPQLLDYLDALARAANVPEDVVLFLNSGGFPPPIRREWIPSDSLFESESDGCTSVASAREDGVIIGHTEDGPPTAFHDLFLLDSTITEPHRATGALRSRFVALCYVYTLPGISASMNDHGLVQAVDALPEGGVRDDGVPCDFISRALLDLPDIDRARGLVRRIPARGGASYILAQGARMVSVEVSAAGMAEREGTDVLCHTNHFLDSSLARLCEAPASNSETRFQRASALVRGGATIAEMKELLADRENFPESICRERTLGAFVADTTSRSIEVCWGEPDSATWTVHRL